MTPQSRHAHRLMELNALFEEVRVNILNRQHPISGLLPASTAVNAHGDYTDAWVRDNVYSILAAWALGIAYRRVDNADARAYELEQATVKNMRGLLTAMMRQSDRVERFKRSQTPTDALHAKYDTATGLAVVGDDEWGHLQLDATSLFVLMLVQMTLSGLRIIASRDEVDFIQNIVWYLSRAYATPDYGIWERGNKINHGQRELNASSLGMVLAALQAVNGFDLFGGDGDDRSRVFVLADDIARTEMTLNALLPRESGSKEVDAALLSVIGFPAFAVRDQDKVKSVDAAVRDKLTGRYGCKRFLRDGHQTVLEDEHKLHYEPNELEKFANIESEWPLFFTYQLINHLFAGNRRAAEAVNQQLQRVAVARDGQLLLPELYFVQSEDINEERRSPGSAERCPNDNQPLVWAQSLWVVGRLLLMDAIGVNDLDPVNRRHHISGQIISRAVSVALVAETSAVDAALIGMGSDRHTVLGQSRVRVGSVRALVENLVDLGANARLGLTGRPRRRVLGLSTAKVYEVEGEQWLIVPQLFDTDDFYLTQDLAMLVQELRSTIAYLHRYWQQPGRPILTVMISEWMLPSPDFVVLLSFLRDELMRSMVAGVPVHLDRVESLVTRAHHIRLPGMMMGWALRPQLRIPHANQPDDPAIIPLDGTESEAVLLVRLAAAPAITQRLAILSELVRRRGGHAASVSSVTDETGRQSTLTELLEGLFRQAQQARAWGVMRRTAELLGKVDAYLEVALMDLLVRQKRLAVGRSYTSKALIVEPLSNHEILNRIKAFCGDDPRERILTQELIVHLGGWIRSDAALFTDVITLRIGPLLQTLIALSARERTVAPGVAFDWLMEQAPSVISLKLREALTWKGGSSRLESLRLADGSANFDALVFRAEDDPQTATEDWLQWRMIEGAIGRLPDAFYRGIWALMAHAPTLVIGDRYNARNTLDCAVWRSQSTAGEKNFALTIEHILNRIVAPEYRQLVIEGLQTLIQIAEKNLGLRVQDALVIDVLIGHAVRLAWCHGQREGHASYDEVRDQAWNAFYQRPPHQVAYYVTEALETLLGMGEHRELIEMGAEK
ncbi:MAG: glycoside hydrolase family 15 protein [Halothiobacillus sp.]